MIDGLLRSKAHNPLYLNRYIKFISTRQEKSDNVYTEKHHILPKSMFPEYNSLAKYRWNGIRLTPREHFLAHWLLAKAYNNGMWLAFKRMLDTDKMQFCNSRTYEICRTNTILINKSKVLSEESKAKIRIARANQIMQPRSEETKERISLANKGTKPSEYTLQKLKEYINNRDASEHPRARKIGIYDNNDNLICTSNGNMREVCKKYDLSFGVLVKTLKESNTVEQKKRMTEPRKKLLGWYARYLS